jgi:hypothetical protein
MSAASPLLSGTHGPIPDESTPAPSAGAEMIIREAM